MAACTIVLYSCGERQEKNNLLLQQAEQALTPHPDSTLILLQSIEHPEELNKKDYANYLFLQVQAHDKTGVNIKNDTLMPISASYYSDTRDSLKAINANLYTARVYLARSNHEEAMRYLLVAKDFAENVNNTKLLGLIYHNIGNAYSRAGSFRKALDSFKRAQSYYSQSGNRKGEVLVQDHIGNMMWVLGEPDSALVYFQKVLEHSEETGNDILASITERTSGETVAAQSAELFNLCGMQNTFHPDTKRYTRLVKGYTEEDNEHVEFDNTSFQNCAAAGLDEMRAKINACKDRLLFEVLLEKNIILKTDNTHIFENKISKDELYYYALVPKGAIKGVLVLLPSILEETESVLENNEQLCRQAYDNGIMTVVPSTNAHICLDTPVLNFLNKTFADVVLRYGAPKDKFIIGGFSLGGIVSLRYTEMAYEDSSRVVPCAAYSVDGPVDFITMYRQFETDIRKNVNWGAVAEAQYYIDGMHQIFGGSPNDAYSTYVKNSVYTRGEDKGGNAQYLKSVPVRIYSDPDIDWVMKQRKRDYYDMNAPDHTAMIIELNLQGNDKAEFVNCLGKGCRMDGTRHPHSWSLVDADDCVQWMLECMKQ